MGRDYRFSPRQKELKTHIISRYDIHAEEERVEQHDSMEDAHNIILSFDIPYQESPLAEMYENSQYEYSTISHSLLKGVQ